jgi:hypothetical protein
MSRTSPTHPLLLFVVFLYGAVVILLVAAEFETTAQTPVSRELREGAPDPDLCEGQPQR